MNQAPNLYQGGDFVSDMKEWWANAPLFVKVTFWATVGLYALSFLNNSLPLMLMNIPKETVGSFQIYRLFFSPFVARSLLEMIFVFLAYFSMAAALERKWGTLRTIVDFFIKNLEINVAYIALTYILSIIMPIMTSVPAYGMWCIFFTQLTQRCMDDPEGVSLLLCLPIQIKTKYYPLFLIALFSLLSGFPRLDIVVAALVGYTHHQYFDTAYNNYLNDSRIQRWEQVGLCAWLRFQPNFIGVSNPGINIPVTRPPQNQQNTGTPTPNLQIPTFAGKGVAIGGTDSNRSDVPPQGKPGQYHQLENTEDDIEKQQSDM